MRALSSSCWCCSRFISILVLFQILMGTATVITVASISSSTDHQFCASMKKNQGIGAA